MKTLIFVVIPILILAVFWKISGLGKGRKFGNKIADSIGFKRNFFHTVLENGVNGPSLTFLSMMEAGGISIEQAAIEVGPSLERGLAKLESRFGSQPQIEAAKPVVAHLVAQWEAARR